MTKTFSVYCDESGHLEHDEVGVMVLGAVWCAADKVPQISARLREIKAEHGQSPHFEVKWKKVSRGGLGLYLSLLDYFFDDDDLHFRALIIPDKTKLHHDVQSQTHDDWYYRMFFTMLMPILEPESRYRIYLDIKDTFSSTKIAKLHDVLANAKQDFSRDIIERMQPVRSHEVELVQIADLLIGTVSYANRHLAANEGKVALVQRMRKRSGLSLDRTTLLREEKTNLFIWSPSEG